MDGSAAAAAIQLNTLPELDQHCAQRILREINQHHRHKFAHFDENFLLSAC